jgi:trehalose 6-phosphate synthase/phosphatase
MTSFASLTQILTVAGEKLKIPSTTLSDDDKTALGEEIGNFKYEDEDSKTKYVPVLLDDKVAHGHYDGYCKQSEISVTDN